MSIDDRIPRINTQVDDVNIFEIQIADYKLVQLYIEEKPYLRIGSMKEKHISILITFLRECNEFGYPIYSDEEITKMIEGYNKYPKKLPSLKTDKYHIVGMGVVSFFSYNSNKIIYFNGDSFDFKIGVNKQHVEDIKPYLPKGSDIRFT